MTDPEVTHVRLLIDTYAACFRFYRDDLGLEPTFGEEESGYAEFATGDVALALFDAEEMEAAVGEASSDGPEGRGRDVAALVLGVEDVDRTYERLAGADCERVAPPRDRPGGGSGPPTSATRTGR